MTEIPYLLRAAKGEILPRPPVWMMRQAGRYMKAYRDLTEKYPSFRDIYLADDFAEKLHFRSKCEDYSLPAVRLPL